MALAVALLALLFCTAAMPPRPRRTSRVTTTVRVNRALPYGLARTASPLTVQPPLV